MTVPRLRRLVAGFPQRRPRFELRSRHVGFVVDIVAPGQVFTDYFGSPRQFSFHRLLHNHHHLSSGAGTMGQIVADVPSGLSLNPPQETIKKTLFGKHRNMTSRGTRLSVKTFCETQPGGHHNIHSRKGHPNARNVLELQCCA
jgi:hypothetical protein